MLWHTINCDYYRLIITTPTIIVPWPQSSLHTQKIILMFYRVQRDGAMAPLPEPHLKLSCPSNSLRRRVLQQGIMSLRLCLCKWTNVNSSRRRWRMMEENRMLASGLHMHAEGVQPPTHPHKRAHTCTPKAQQHPSREWVQLFGSTPPLFLFALLLTMSGGRMPREQML